MEQQVVLFISTVTNEFRAYRDELANTLRRPGMSIKVQEDFIASGDTTLLKLDEYIQRCDAVIHLVGDATGGLAREPALDGLRRRYPDWPRQQAALAGVLEGSAGSCSYTQWEAYLAIFHHKTLLVCVPEGGAPRDPGFEPEAAERELQHAHLDRLRQCGRYAEISFANSDKLIIHLLRSKLQELLPPAKVPINLQPSIGPLFKGRQEFLAKVRAAWRSADSATAPVTRVAIHGLGGIGKTQVAAEYGHIFAGSYSALLAVSAKDKVSLKASVADLTGCLRLSVRTDPQVEPRYQAALEWLEDHPNWFLLVDNVDTDEVFREVDALIRRLGRGHILITSRIRIWPQYVRNLELDVLSLEHSTEYLLEATADMRASRGKEQDRADAATLAKELGQLALALTQAAAFIRTKAISLAEYLADWQKNKPALLEDPDFDPVQTGYPRSVAVTWVTTVQQLAPEARFLLETLCWLAADPIPDRLLQSPWPATALEHVPEAIRACLSGRSARTALLKYSMLTTQPIALDQLLLIHRLVQEVGRIRQQREGTAEIYAACAVLWVAADFVRPQTIQNLRHNRLPEARPLMPHVRELLGHAIGHGLFGVPMARAQLRETLAAFYHAQSLYAEAEKTASLAVSEARALTQVPELARGSRLCLARSLSTLAHTYNDQGHYRKSIDVAKEAASATQGWRTELAEDSEVLHEHIMALWTLGDTLLGQGNKDEAQSVYEGMLSLARDLSQKDSGNLLYQRDLSVALNRVGNLHEVAQGDLGAVLAAYEEALGLARALLRQEPANLLYRRDLAITLYRLGLLLVAQGEKAKARVFHVEALEGLSHLQGDSASVLRLIYNVRHELWLLDEWTETEEGLSEEHPVFFLSATTTERLAQCPVDTIDWQRDYWDRSLRRVQDDSRCHRLLEGQRQALTELGLSADAGTAQMWDLPYYPSLALALLRQQGQPIDSPPTAWVLLGEQRCDRLDGAASSIHTVNGQALLALTEENAVQYLKFFCFFVQADGHRFVIFDDQTAPTGYSGAAQGGSGSGPSLRPSASRPANSPYCYRVTAVVLHRSRLFEARFSMGTTGEVNMTEDRPFRAF